LKTYKLLICAAVGVVAGAGFYTFKTAKGLSYLSDDPKACMNCHVMGEHYESWVKSSHHAVATCNDCHTPHGFPDKWITKARNGWNHSKAFTLQNFPEPIRITALNLDALQHNCVECHDMLVSDIAGHKRAGAAAQRCTVCHRSAGHMSLD
jgi:cytochrome c nitrite reductase small subunit